MRLVLALFLLFHAVPAMATVLKTGTDDAATVAGAAVRVDTSFSIFVDGREVQGDVGPVVKGGEVFVPIRFVTEALGARVEWIETDRVARISRGLDSVRVGEGDVQVQAGKDVLELEHPPFIHRGRLMVPLLVTARGIGMTAVTQEESIHLESPGVANNAAVDRVVAGIDLAFWLVAFAVLLWRLSPRAKATWGPLMTADVVVLLLCLVVLAPVIATFARSHMWAALVPCGTALSGVLSRERYHNRLATMAESAMGLGLIGTLLGLGFIIGPAVASHDVSAIGYGISVKIEASITGLGLSLLLNTILGNATRE